MSRYSDKLQYVSTNERFSVIGALGGSAAQLREDGRQMRREPIITSPGKWAPLFTRE
jgi:hypothetical protein